MPYRVDIADPPEDALDLLVELGALDVESTAGGIAALLPDSVPLERIRGLPGGAGITVSDVAGRDNGSVWLLGPRAVRLGCLVMVPAEFPTSPGALRLTDSQAFGTGHHPTTALCVEALQDILAFEHPGSILDVGTGSGILALSALLLGVPQAIGLDVDAAALTAAAENARLNSLDGRLRLVLGGPAAVEGTFPLVVANVLAAPLVEMAPVLVRRLGPHGRLILSGIPVSLETEVREAYRHLGVRHTGSKTRAGWTALTLQASW